MIDSKELKKFEKKTRSENLDMKNLDMDFDDEIDDFYQLYQLFIFLF